MDITIDLLVINEICRMGAFVWLLQRLFIKGKVVKRIWVSSTLGATEGEEIYVISCDIRK